MQCRTPFTGESRRPLVQPYKDVFILDIILLNCEVQVDSGGQFKQEESNSCSIECAIWHFNGDITKAKVVVNFVLLLVCSPCHSRKKYPVMSKSTIASLQMRMIGKTKFSHR